MQFLWRNERFESVVHDKLIVQRTALHVLKNAFLIWDLNQSKKEKLLREKTWQCCCQHETQQVETTLDGDFSEIHSDSEKNGESYVAVVISAFIVGTIEIHSSKKQKLWWSVCFATCTRVPFLYVFYPGRFSSLVCSWLSCKPPILQTQRRMHILLFIHQLMMALEDCTCTQRI